MKLDETYKAPRISSEYKDCSMPITFDQYKKCGFGCLYCFATFQRSVNPTSKDFYNYETLKSANFNSFKRLFTGKNPDSHYWKHYISKRKTLQWGSMADPFCPFEEKTGHGYKFLKILAELKYPVRFSTKGTLMLKGKYKKLLEKYAEDLKGTWAFMLSIITTDGEVARKIEPGVPSPENRYNALKELKDMGYYTVHRLRPFMLGISDKILDEMLKRDVEVGINAISVEFFCLDIRVPRWVRKRYSIMSELAGFDYIHYYKKNSPDSSGYYRLNPKVKLPTYTRYGTGHVRTE